MSQACSTPSSRVRRTARRPLKRMPFSERLSLDIERTVKELFGLAGVASQMVQFGEIVDAEGVFGVVLSQQLSDFHRLLNERHGPSEVAVHLVQNRKIGQRSGQQMYSSSMPPSRPLAGRDSQAQEHSWGLVPR